MSLIHAGLAAGAALAALPVILHLFMRQTPKHLIFPALRLIRERQRQSKKRMRIKNWLLLLARMAILALMALALARPQIYSDVPLGDDSMPMALGLVFDTSLSMDYKDKDKTRLDEAKERAKDIVSKLPDSSQVFVVDSAEPGAPIGLSPAAAIKRIESRVIRAVNRPLNEVMGQVYPVVAECDRPARMVYVLTDLCRSAWSPDRAAEGIDEVAKLNSKKGSKLATLILRLAPKEIENFSVVSADPSPSVVPQGMPVEVRARIHYDGEKPAKRMVEFELDGQKRGEKPVELAPKQQTEVSFPARIHEGDLHQGLIKLSGDPDPFEKDDIRYFTFRVRPSLKVLIVSDQSFDTVFLAGALDPHPDSKGARPIIVEKVRTADLSSRYHGEYRSFATIFLLNVREVPESDWGPLNRYVHEGGGLVVAPGYLSRPESYNNPVATQILPAQLADRPHVANPRTTMGKISNATHPLFAQYTKDLDTVLAQVPVYRYWPTREPAEGSRTLLSFADQAPALLERTIQGPKAGRVFLWTTPLSRAPDYGGGMQTDPGAWSEFPLPKYGWSFFFLMNQTVPYLAGVADEPLNFNAGQTVSLHLEPSAHLTNFVLSSSDPKVTPRALPTPSNDFLEVAAPQDLGLWTVKATAPDSRATTLGFSINPPPAESEFTLLERSDLDVIFGKDRYQLADDAVAHKEAERKARFGYEIFPWLMFLILMIVTLENFLANTFYREAPKANAVGAAS